jgi:hypothetical protein
MGFHCGILDGGGVTIVEEIESVSQDGNEWPYCIYYGQMGDPDRWKKVSFCSVEECNAHLQPLRIGRFRPDVIIFSGFTEGDLSLFKQTLYTPEFYHKQLCPPRIYRYAKMLDSRDSL